VRLQIVIFGFFFVDLVFHVHASSSFFNLILILILFSFKKNEILFKKKKKVYTKRYKLYHRKKKAERDI